ncbi:MAG: hypothetical protein ACLTKG_05950 [Collinsella intestinalis]
MGQRVGHRQIGRSDSDYVRYRIIRADGEVRWVDDWGHLVEDAAGTRWFYATIMDATERVREKEELRRANERLEILTALSNDVLFDIECGTGKAHVYGDFEGRFGRAPEQGDFVVSRRCQKPCELTITSHDLTPLMAQIGENSLVDFETSTSGADGDPVWYRYQSVVLYDEESIRCATWGVCWTRVRRPCARASSGARPSATASRGFTIALPPSTASRRRCVLRAVLARLSWSMWTISRL